MPVAEAEAFFADGEAKVPAAHKVLERLADVGLGYLTLGQPLTTLSGGERQRLKLATHLGEKGDVFVLDEPTTGPAPGRRRAAARPARPARGCGPVGDRHRPPPGVMAHADWIIDLGPGAGYDGGRVVFEGTPADLVAARSTLTGEHLAEYVGVMA
jgi:excinuclease UvrABC ATPase subunit